MTAIKIESTDIGIQSVMLLPKNDDSTADLINTVLLKADSLSNKNNIKEQMIIAIKTEVTPTTDTEIVNEFILPDGRNQTDSALELANTDISTNALDFIKPEITIDETPMNSGFDLMATQFDNESDEPNLFECKLCYRTFKKRSLFTNHLCKRTLRQRPFVKYTNNRKKTKNFAPVQLKKGAVRCKVCGKVLESRKGYNTHFTRVHLNLQRKQEESNSGYVENDKIIAKWKRELDCPLCSATVSNFFSLKVHFWQEHPDDKCHIICCDSKFTTRFKLVQHLKCHERKHLKCHKRKHQKSFKPLTIHQEKKPNQNQSRIAKYDEIMSKWKSVWECPLCQAKLSDFNLLRAHFSEYHPDDRCHILCCNRKIMGRYLIVRHINAHKLKRTGCKVKNDDYFMAKWKKEWECPLCKSICLNFNLLKAHFSAEHPDDKCHIVCCNRKLQTNPDIVKHIRYHELKKWITKWDCPLCQAEFSNFNRLKIHFNDEHPDDKCHIVCCKQKLMTQLQIWNHHRMLHENQRRKVENDEIMSKWKSEWECPLCKLTKPNFDSLKVHFSDEHPNDECHIVCCNTKLSRRRQIIIHINGHNKKRNIRRFENDDLLAKWKSEWQCPLCESIFLKFYLLKTHFKYEHPGNKCHIVCCNRKLNRLQIVKHIKTHNNRIQLENEEFLSKWYGQLECALCKVTCSKYFTLEIHFQKEHPGISCHVTCCKLSLCSRADIVDHLKLHMTPILSSKDHHEIDHTMENDLKHSVAEDIQPIGEMKSYIIKTEDNVILNHTVSDVEAINNQYHNVDEFIQPIGEIESYIKIEDETILNTTTGFVEATNKQNQTRFDAIQQVNNIAIDHTMSNDLAHNIDEDSEPNSVTDKINNADNKQFSVIESHLKIKNDNVISKPTTKSVVQPIKQNEIHIDDSIVTYSKTINTSFIRFQNEDFIARSKGELECAICKNTFERYGLLHSHFREQHPTKKCHVLCCKRKFYYQWQIVEHLKYHSNPNAFTCNVCKTSFSKVHYLRQHLRRAHAVSREEAKLIPKKLDGPMETCNNKNNVEEFNNNNNFANVPITSTKLYVDNEVIQNSTKGTVKQLRKPNTDTIIQQVNTNVTRNINSNNKLAHNTDGDSEQIEDDVILNPTNIIHINDKQQQQDDPIPTRNKTIDKSSNGKRDNALKNIENEDFIARWKGDLECSICKNSFEKYGLLQSHFCNRHPTEKCHVVCCKRKFYHLWFLVDHVKFHVNPNACKCRFCGTSLTGLIYLKRHLQNIHAMSNEQANLIINQQNELFETSSENKAYTITNKSQITAKLDNLTSCCNRDTEESFEQNQTNSMDTVEEEFYNNVDNIKTNSTESYVKDAVIQNSITDNVKQSIKQNQIHLKMDNEDSEQIKILNATTGSVKQIIKQNKIPIDVMQQHDSSNPTPSKTIDKSSNGIRYKALKNIENEEFIARWRGELECPICKNSFEKYYLLFSHFRKQHPNEKCHVVCCKRKLYYPCHIVDHLKNHINKKAFKCRLCGIIFNTCPHLKTHLRQTHALNNKQANSVAKLMESSNNNAYAINNETQITGKLNDLIACNSDTNESFERDQTNSMETEEEVYDNVDNVQTNSTTTQHANDVVILNSTTGNVEQSGKQNQIHSKIDNENSEKTKIKYDYLIQQNNPIPTPSKIIDASSNEKYASKTIENEEFIARWKGELECPICKNTFKKYGLLTSHFREQHPTKKCHVVCCKRKLLYAWQVVEHLKYHINPNAFKCKLCGTLYTQFQILKSHLQMAHGMNKEQANLTVKQQSELMETSDTITNENQKTLNHNDLTTWNGEQDQTSSMELEEEFNNKNADNEEVEKSPNKKTTTGLKNDAFIAKWKGILECPLCNDSFNNFGLLQSHFKIEHSSQKCFVVCCNKKLYNRFRICHHLKTHINPNAFKCKICNRFFSDDHSLKLHMSLQHSKKRENFCCDHCYEQCPTVEALYWHMEKCLNKKCKTLETPNSNIAMDELSNDESRLNQMTYNQEGQQTKFNEDNNEQVVILIKDENLDSVKKQEFQEIAVDQSFSASKVKTEMNETL